MPIRERLTSLLTVRTKSKNGQTAWNALNNRDQAAIRVSFTSNWVVGQGTCKIVQEKTNTIHNYYVEFLPWKYWRKNLETWELSSSLAYP